VVLAAACSDWPLKIRCTLKNKNPLIADENNVVRQRATVLRPRRAADSRQREKHCSLFQSKDPFFVIGQGQIKEMLV